MKILHPFAFLTALLVATLPALAGNLVDTKWLAKNLESKDVLVIDAQPGPMHAKAHIPGAVPVDVMQIAAFGARDMPAAAMEKVYQAAGISPSKRIVLYDQGGTWFATRVFFA